MSATPGYLELDFDGTGLELLLDGVVAAGDELRLAPVPSSPEPIGQLLDPTAVFSGPAGIAVDDAGDVYVADPHGNRVLRIGACETDGAPLGCITGPGSDPGLVDTPRGVAVGPRRRLFVADSGNDRVQAFDLQTFQLVQVIGGVAEPWDLAVDSAGSLYVVSHGDNTVSKFDVDGAPVFEFAQTLAAQAVVPTKPSSIAVAVVEGEERVVVVDSTDHGRLLAYGLDGTFDSARTDAWNAALAAVAVAAAGLGGVAVGGGTLYVGEDATGGVLAFTLDGTFLGRAAGVHEGAAGLALDAQGRLLVHPGTGQPLRLAVQGVVQRGMFRLGPVALAHPPGSETLWQRLFVGASLGGPSHVRVFTYTSDRPDDPPPLPDGAAAAGPETTPLECWRPAPLDALDVLVLNEPGPYLWIGGQLEAGAGGAPAIQRVRIEHDRDGWLPLLPAIYARDDSGRVFLSRLLALTESALEDEAALLDSLPRLFGAASAPDDAPDGWLDWLAGWLAFPLEERWTEQIRRGAVAGAFELNGRRGTAAGLRDLIRLDLGLDATVSEPGEGASLWQLGGDAASQLGFTTQLAGAEADGAVLGTTAILGESDLIDAGELGAPLFEELASRFCVNVYAADLTDPETLDELQRLVERERPAEAAGHVCVIEPRARVGFQARLGVDAIVAAGPGRLTLGGGGGLGVDTALSPDAEGEPAQLGRARVGVTTHLA